MSWQDRPYSTGNDPGGGYGGGARSWLGGLPPAGKAVKWIALANAALFLLCQITGREGSPIYQWLAMQTPLVLKGQIWRLFTFTYLHDQQGLMHIIFNMLGLYFLGTPLERQWGSKRFFMFYTLGGFVGVLLYFAATLFGFLNPYSVLIGASGGVLATLGACAVLFPQFRIILFIFPVPIRTAALLFVVVYSFNLLNQGVNAGGDACHLAGLAFGILWGYRGHTWGRTWQRKREEFRRGAWETKRREQQHLEDDVDRILEKLNRQGINSLSRREKRALEAATKIQRDADRRHRL